MVEGNVSSEQKAAPRLIDVPFEKVEGVFAGFVIPEERGGYRVSATRERSFSHEQRPYITTVNAVLRRKILGQTREDDRSLSERMATHFMEQGENPSFRKAMYDSLFAIVKETGTTQANLTPALEALLALGGAQGLQTTVNMSATRLSNAVYAKKMDVGLIKTPDTLFLNPHYKEDTKYDVQCGSPVVARTILEEAERAAIQLAQDTTLRGKYNEPDTSALQRNFPDTILHLAHDLHEQARLSQQEETSE